MSLAPPSPVVLDVSVLRWPEQDDLRRQLAWVAQPRLLLVAAGATPPLVLDPLEDWIREPADADDLRARGDVLRLRATAPGPLPPTLDDDGLLWRGDRWVAITSSQEPVVRLLLDNIERVVRVDAIVAAYAAGGGSSHPASVRTLFARVAARVRVVGLELITVRRRGLLLTATPDARSPR